MRMVLLAALIVPTPKLGFAQQYSVQSGDTLSKIVEEHTDQKSGPLYGKNGRLVKVLLLNPQIQNAQYIFPGDVLILQGAPSGTQSLSQSKKLMPSNSERKVAQVDVNSVTGSAVQPSSDDTAKSVIGASVGFEFSKFDATDKITEARAAFLSGMSPMYRIFWRLDWTPKWSSQAELGVLSEEVLEDTTNNRSLKNAGGARKTFKFSMIRNFSSLDEPVKHSFKISVGMQDRLFMHTIDSSTLSIDRIPTYFFDAQMRTSLISLKKVSFGIAAEIKNFLPGAGEGYTTQSGYGAEGKFFMEHKTAYINLFSEVGYGIAKQESSLVQVKEQSLNCILGASWNLGD